MIGGRVCQREGVDMKELDRAVREGLNEGMSKERRSGVD